MNDTQKKTYIAWLNDAHAMELGLVTVLEKQIQEAPEDNPAMLAKLQEHLEETKHHAELMEECVKRNDGSVSSIKDISSKITAALQGMGMSMMDDAIVKNVHTSYAAEHFEIATYTLLQSAAEALGDDETASACEEILEDEIDMANWLLEQLPEVVEEHLEVVQEV